MTPGARLAAAADILDDFLSGLPVDKVLANWARSNRYAGSKDRAAVRDIVFDCLRNLRSFQARSGQNSGRGLTIGHCLANGLALEGLFSGEGYAPQELSDEERSAIKGSVGIEEADFQDWMMPLLKGSLGSGFERAARHMSDRAPVDLRVNTLKGDVSSAIKLLASEGVATCKVEGVPTALRVVENPRRVANSKAYQQGLVELQDAASQAVVDLLELRSGMTVLDYCAGGGGKTLALAAKCPSARISAWDVEARRLKPLVERAKRASAKVQVLETIDDGATFDLVVVDAPCSGSGSWRRNPEGKWRLSQEDFQSLLTTQSNILALAAKLVKPGGVLAYLTCSVLKEENMEQLTQFLNERSEFALSQETSFGLCEPGDGFFCATIAFRIKPESLRGRGNAVFP